MCLEKHEKYKEKLKEQEKFYGKAKILFYVANKIYKSNWQT